MSKMHYKHCPKCGAANDSGPADQCAACGIYYAKWLKASLASAAAPGTNKESATNEQKQARKEWRSFISPEFWLQVEEKVNPFEFAGRCLLLAILVVWGGAMIQTDFRITTGLFAELSFYSSFLGSVTLAFHEAGHVIFMPFGRFMAVLGGSLFQLLVPAALMLGFIYKYKNAFAGSVALWWLGYSCIDLAPYIYDAQDMQLLLVGGGTGRETGGHDWNNLLRWTDSL